MGAGRAAQHTLQEGAPETPEWVRLGGAKG